MDVKQCQHPEVARQQALPLSHSFEISRWRREENCVNANKSML